MSVPSPTPEEMVAASAYEQSLVPALFREWPPRVAAAARLEKGHRVLDVGCGTGILARHAASIVGPDGSVAGVDPNAGMLAVAAQHAPAGEWKQGAAEALPFPDQSFDAVVSQFALMFFADRRKAVQEMLRVLRPQGRLAVAVWDRLEATPAYAAEVALLARIIGERAADAMRAPFSLGDRDALAAIFTGAGAASPAVETHKGAGRFPSIRAMVEPDLYGWLPIMGVVLTQPEIDRVLQEAENALRPYATPDGRVEFECSAHIVSASRQ